MNYQKRIMKFLSFFYLHVSQKITNFAAVIELQRHIEVLLLENKCVIVPDFGGFIAHEMPARYDEEDRLFLPPLLTLGFNPQLKMNDSLLAQSYAEALDISLPEAMRHIEAEVEELKALLNEQGEYELDNLGTLTVNHEGNYEFQPCEAGILAPELYGLSSFPFAYRKDHAAPQADKQKPVVEAPALTSVQVGEEQSDDAAAQQEPSLLDFVETDDDSHAIEVKMSWVRNAVAIAAAVVAFFLLSTPIANSDWGSKTMSQLQNGVLFRLIPQDTNYTPSEPVVAELREVKKGAEVKKEAEVEMDAEAKQAIEQEQVAAPQQAAEPRQAAEQKQATASKQAEEQKQAATGITYCIVLASQVKLSNAEAYVESLHRQGYKKASVWVHDHVVRVIFGEYQSKEEAYKQLNQLYNDPEFSEAWVYTKKAEA